MVVALGPGKFYGSSLPRPRIYTELKHNEERVDPPIPVMEPLLSWAHDAHWSMGGLSFKRHRLQGRIEGSIKKLRAEDEKKKKVMMKEEKKKTTTKRVSDSPVSFIVDDDDDGKQFSFSSKNKKKKKRARKLADEFDCVGEEEIAKHMEGKKISTAIEMRQNKKHKKSDMIDGPDSIASRTRSRRSENADGGGEE